jgi:N-glycosylase/DNA lyase
MKQLVDFNQLEYAVVKLTENMNFLNHQQSWSTMNEKSLWFELVACILGSGVVFEHAQNVVKNLKDRGCLELLKISNFSEFEANIYKVLLEFKYRFPRIRAEYLRKTAEMIYGAGFTLTDLLSKCGSTNEARTIIMVHSKGIGPKQSSMFLRNIGYSDDLAILDSHVLKYMFSIGLLDTLIKSVSNMSFYKKLEERLKQYSNSLKVTLSNLDTAIWVVMRVFQREFSL